MPKQGLAEWLRDLPEEVTEVRVRAGATSSSWEPVCTLLVHTEGPRQASEERIRARCDGYVSIRCDAYDAKGKHLDNWQETRAGAAAADGGAAGGGDPVNLLGLFNRVLTQNLLLTREVSGIVHAAGAPLQALANAHESAVMRERESTANELAALKEALELHGVAEQALSVLDGEVPGAGDSLRDQAAELVRNIASAFKGAGVDRKAAAKKMASEMSDEDVDELFDDPAVQDKLAKYLARKVAKGSGADGNTKPT